jgi:DNA-binding SARP family transcriptional activator/Tfp pilus assembly protein PilF
VEFRVLGPLEVWKASQRVQLGGAKSRRVLAALVCEPGRLVTVDGLVDAVWGEQPPHTARKQVQNAVSALRQSLDGSLLVARDSGYVLEVPWEWVDACRFDKCLARASAARLAGDTVRAAQALRAGLDLWRGPALAGVGGRVAEAVATRLQERRLSAITQWAEIVLELGQHAAMVEELMPVVDEFPLREPLAGLLVLALYRCGRGAEAVARYHQTRQALADELGVEPGRQLQGLFEQILRTDGSTPTSPTATAARLVPAQLPPDVHGFTGRADELASLDALIAGGGQPTAVVISAVSGTAGVGKTTLAVHWAHRVQDRFPDGQLYVNLRGFDPSGKVMAPTEAIRRFLDALAVPPHRIPADPGAQADLFRTLLAGKRMLVVLDNARDPDQVRPLLPGAASCLVLVTSRSKLTGLIAAEGARALPLDLLTPDEARDLLTRRLGPARVAAEPDAVDELINRCARLPLALAIVAANAATNPNRSLAALAEQLRHSQDRLDVLSTSDTPATDVRAVFSWSYRALSEEAVRLFRLLGLHPGPDFSVAAAASLAAQPIDQVRPLLNELVGAHLLVEHAPGRYTLHDLLRTYAAEQAHRMDPDEQRRAATVRMLEHYLHTAYTAARLLDSGRDPITLKPLQAGVTPEHLVDHDQALEWFAAERAVLLAAVDHAAAAGSDTYTWQLAWSLDTFLDRRGHWHDLAAVQLAAVAAAGRLADPPVQARAHRLLGLTYSQLGRFDDAHTHLRHALDLTIQTGDLVGQANAHRILGYVCERQGRHGDALDCAKQAHDLFRVAGHRVGQASTLNAVGWFHALLGDHRQALTCCRQALTLFQELDNTHGQAATWDSLGYAHHHLGHHAQAITCYQHALNLYRDLSDRYDEADILIHLGDTHQAAGNPEAAKEAWQHALTILEQLDHPNADHARAKLANL